MKVDNPRFNPLVGGDVYCEDCPWADSEGDATDGDCSDRQCPANSDQYQEACRLAEQANKGEKDAGR